MSNPWVKHVKDYAEKNNLSYMCAMSTPACKASYVKPTPVKKIKTTVAKPTTVPKAVIVSKPATVPKVAPKVAPKVIIKQPEIKTPVSINTSKYLSGFVGINKSSNTFKYNTSSEKKNNIKDAMFDIIDNKFLTFEVNKLVDALNIDIGKVLERTRDFYDKKIDANKTVEYTDFVSLVIYPSLIKNTPKKSLTIEDKIILLLYANDIANDLMFSEVKPINKGSVIMGFLKPSTIGARLVNYLGKDFQKLYEDYGMS